MPAVALEKDAGRYPATHAGVADITLRVNATTS